MNHVDKDIYDVIGLAATLEQLAEECCEAAHASLKLARILRGDSPTPVTKKEAIEKLTEEMADVSLVGQMVIDHSGLISWESIESWELSKLERWAKRLGIISEDEEEEVDSLSDILEAVFGPLEEID